MKKLLLLLLPLGLFSSCNPLNEDGSMSVIGSFFDIMIVMIIGMIIAAVYQNSPAQKEKRRLKTEAYLKTREPEIKQYNDRIIGADVVINISGKPEGEPDGSERCFAAFFENNEILRFYLNSVCEDIPYSSLRGVEVLVDNNVVYEKSGIGRAVVGGILAGGAGAIVGATTGKTKQKDELKSIVLRIMRNDLRNPVIEAKLFGDPLHNNPDYGVLVLKFANRVSDTISVIIDRIVK